MINELYEIFAYRLTARNFLTDWVLGEILDEVCEDIKEGKDENYIVNKIEKLDELICQSYRGTFVIPNKYKSEFNFIQEYMSYIIDNKGVNNND